MGHSATIQNQETIKKLCEGDVLQLRVNRYGDGWIICTSEGLEIGALSKKANEDLTSRGISPQKFQFQLGEVTVRYVYRHLKTDATTGIFLRIGLLLFDLLL